MVATQGIAGYARPGIRAFDLGAGPGARCQRLQALGEVVAVDRGANLYPSSHPLVAPDLNHNAFAFGMTSFDLVIAVEPRESPVNFLRNIAPSLVSAGGAVITAPNVDSMPAHLSFLFKGRTRMMDEVSDPTHFSRFFSDLLRRPLLPRPGLPTAEPLLFPSTGYRLTRKVCARPVAAAVFTGNSVRGNHHFFLSKAAA